MGTSPCVFSADRIQKVMVINMCDKIWQQLVYKYKLSVKIKPVPDNAGVL